MPFKGKKNQAEQEKMTIGFNVYVPRCAGTLSFKLGSHFPLIQIQKFGQTGISGSCHEFFYITMDHSVKYRRIDVKKENTVAKFSKRENTKKKLEREK